VVSLLLSARDRQLQRSAYARLSARLNDTIVCHLCPFYRIHRKNEGRLAVEMEAANGRIAAGSRARKCAGIFSGWRRPVWGCERSPVDERDAVNEANAAFDSADK
jgi:hypothetical protein